MTKEITAPDISTMVQIVSQLIERGIGFEAKKESGEWIIKLH